jgi:hypothetical protein
VTLVLSCNYTSIPGVSPVIFTLAINIALLAVTDSATANARNSCTKTPAFSAGQRPLATVWLKVGDLLQK